MKSNLFLNRWPKNLSTSKTTIKILRAICQQYRSSLWCASVALELEPAGQLILRLHQSRSSSGNVAERRKSTWMNFAPLFPNLTPSIWSRNSKRQRRNEIALLCHFNGWRKLRGRPYRSSRVLKSRTSRLKKQTTFKIVNREERKSRPRHWSFTLREPSRCLHRLNHHWISRVTPTFRKIWVSKARRSKSRWME